MEEASRAALEANLAHVRERMARAAARSGRSPSAVRLVAVTKTVTAGVAEALLRLGVQDLGENRVQALAEKQVALRAAGGAPTDVTWHMIGHLQRNKVKSFLETGAFLHSLDGPRLAEALARGVENRGFVPGDGPLKVLVEVNVSGEGTKGGVPPSELEALLEGVRAQRLVDAVGLMTMAPLAPDPERARPHFRALRELFERHRPRFSELEELSMGMSQDFEVAIEEGATLVRVGSALFEGLSAEHLERGGRA